MWILELGAIFRDPLKDVLYMELDDSRPTGINNPNVNVEMIILERGELKTKVSREGFEFYQKEYKRRL